MRHPCDLSLTRNCVPRYIPTLQGLNLEAQQAPTSVLDQHSLFPRLHGGGPGPPGGNNVEQQLLPLVLNKSPFQASQVVQRYA
jgi:hypothetical protein